MESTNLFMVIVFALGVSIGGLTVSLHRQCTIERIKKEFESQLHDLVRSAAVDQQQTVGRSASAPTRTVVAEEAEPDENSWGYLPPASEYRPEITHSSV